jgi:translation elongation factor EF-G
MIGAQVQGMRVVLTDGQAHAVDSSDLAFRLAAAGAVRTAMRVSVCAVSKRLAVQAAAAVSSV